MTLYINLQDLRILKKVIAFYKDEIKSIRIFNEACQPGYRYIEFDITDSTAFYMGKLFGHYHKEII